MFAVIDDDNGKYDYFYEIIKVPRWKYILYSSIGRRQNFLRKLVQQRCDHMDQDIFRDRYYVFEKQFCRLGMVIYISYYTIDNTHCPECGLELPHVRQKHVHKDSAFCSKKCLTKVLRRLALKTKIL